MNRSSDDGLVFWCRHLRVSADNGSWVWELVGVPASVFLVALPACSLCCATLAMSGCGC
jgi:hypothetical protein